MDLLAVYYIRRLVIFTLMAWFYVPAVVSQTYSYTEKEIFFNRDKEQVKLFVQPDGKFHLWQWGNGSVVLNVYDDQLSFLFSKKISSRLLGKLSFIRFDGLYYAWLAESKEGRLYLVEGDTCIDKTAALAELPLELMPVSQIVQSSKTLFFIQQRFDDSIHQSQVHITTADSHLQYINTLHFRINYTSSAWLNLRISAVDDQLFLMNTAIDENTAKLTVHKVDVINGKVLSKTFTSIDRRFIPSQLQSYGTGFLLQGLAVEPVYTPRWGNAYAYSMKLDSNLNVTNSFYTGLPEVETSVLLHKAVLTIDYRRIQNQKTRNIETQLGYHLLDTNLQVVQYVSKPTVGYSRNPGYAFSSKNAVTIFYEEEFKMNKFAVHSFPLTGNTADDRIIQLQPKFRYIVSHAVHTSDNTFVMPYLHRYSHMGLVRVKVLQN